MKIHSMCLVLAAKACSVVATEGHQTTSSNSGTDIILTPLNNYGGRVNPEDLTPMPQCVTQQDQSVWLNAMTKCTSKICTRHFGFICTHHQWLTQLSCLNTEFSADVLKSYLPYCSRSVLAKAQLYQWIHEVTSRTWLIDVGDANGLQDLSPASLARGYSSMNVVYRAPTCLRGSSSALSMELFRHVMGSCYFTGATKPTGNAARPWEYNQSLQSMTALTFELVGYTNLTGTSIQPGDYFDKDCFCTTFTLDFQKEPCSEPGNLDLTKERLWMNATCGSKSLPDNWTDHIKTTAYSYIPLNKWKWPSCVTDMPKWVTDLPNRCGADACEVDSGGYCNVKRSVDRECFCHNINYDSCGGLCHTFETRIEYINWLHNLCGDVRDWQGLPEDWRRLAGPTPFDMTPWPWTVKPSNDSGIAGVSGSGFNTTSSKCVSNQWKIASLALVNVAVLVTAIISRATGLHLIARGFLWLANPSVWIISGFFIAALQLIAYWLGALIVQNTTDFQDVPILQLVLLWCSIPRPALLTILLIGIQPVKEINFSMAASSLLAEAILQSLSSYYMIMTVDYGREHNFYFGALEGAERGDQARMMYVGAFMWVIAMTALIPQIFQSIRRMDTSIGSPSSVSTRRQNSKLTTETIAGGLVDIVYDYCRRLEDKVFTYLGEKRDRGDNFEEAPLLGIMTDSQSYTIYGTLQSEGQVQRSSRREVIILYIATAICMLGLWIAQWLFWSGFIGLSKDEFCPPKLGVLTFVWIAFSLTGATVGASV